jgi:hypothetical protein
MGALPRKWIKWIAMLLGVAGMLTPALLELGWIPTSSDVQSFRRGRRLVRPLEQLGVVASEK